MFVYAFLSVLIFFYTFNSVFSYHQFKTDVVPSYFQGPIRSNLYAKINLIPMVSKSVTLFQFNPTH